MINIKLFTVGACVLAAIAMAGTARALPLPLPASLTPTVPPSGRLLHQPLNSQAAQEAAQVIVQHLASVGTDDNSPTDPYQAAQRFLRERGLRVDHAASLDILPRLPASSSSLLLLGKRRDMARAQIERLLAWVNQGGRLLLVADAFWDPGQQRSADPLLDRLQLRQYPAISLAPAPPEPDPFPWLTKLYLDNEAMPAYFSFDPASHLEDPADLARAWANSAAATHLMQIDYGAGVITVITDADLWNNQGLGQYDNAWLLWYLNQYRDVAMVYPLIPPPPASLRWQPLAPAALGLAAWLALLLCYLSTGERPWRGHAAGWRPFAWPGTAALPGMRERDRLVRQLQRDLLDRARRRHPGLARLPVADQWQAVARLTGHSPSSVGQALRPRPLQSLSPGEFTRQVAHLQRLRNAL